MAEKSAVYFQRSKAVHEEFRLIEAATSREVIVGKLQKIIKSVKEKRLEMVDEVILETFQLLNELRDVTMRLIKAIKAWQDSFTRPVRPTIYNCDYIIDRMIKHVDFINGSKVRKIFNFQFFRGNPLLLPYPNLKTGDPIKVHAALAKEIRTFANPNEDDVIECYQFLLNCLPPEIYNEKLVSMQKWLIEPWVPRIFATSNTAVPCFPSSKQQVQINLQKEYGNRTSGVGGGETPGGNRAPSPGTLRDRRNSATSQTSKSSASSGHPPVGRPQPLPTIPLPAGRRRLGAQPIAETSQAGKAKGTSSPVARIRSTSNDGNDSTDPLLSAMGDMSPPQQKNAMNNAQRMKMRRNMMVHRDQQQAMAVITGDADLISVASDGTHQSQTSETPKLTEAQQAQVQQLDLYYQELEGMFLPKFGRRAVQTMVAGGERQRPRSPSSPTGNDDDEDDDGHGNQQEFQYRTKRAFSMFTSKAFEKRLDDAEQGIRTENFIRTDAQLIQKRNRILEQRGKNDAEYRSNTNANANGNVNSNGSPARLQASPSGKSLGSIPEQATTPAGGSSRRARTRSGDGTENGDDEDDGEGDEEEDDYGEDDYGDDGDDGGDDDGDGNGNGNGNGEAPPGALSRSSSLVKRPRSRQTSSVSFALRVESSSDQVKNQLRPPKIQIPPSSVNAVSKGTRPRLDSQESGNSSIMNVTNKAGGRGHRRERTQSTGSDSNAGSAVSPLPPVRRGMDKQDSASSFGGGTAAAMSRTSSGSSLRASRRPDSSHSQEGRRPRSRSRSKSPQHGSRRGGSQPGSPTPASPSGRSPIHLSTARMRQWYVENARREAALQRQQMLAGKLP